MNDLSPSHLSKLNYSTQKEKSKYNHANIICELKNILGEIE